MLKAAIYISDHGYGHAARMAALAEELIKFGIQIGVRCSRPDFLFSSLQGPFFWHDPASIDMGVAHGEGLMADLSSTRNALLELMNSRAMIVEREINWLRDKEIDFAIVDVPFLAIEACRYANIPVIAVSNFEWAFIYGRLFRQERDLRPLINTIFSLYGLCDFALRLPFSSRHSMNAFNHSVKTGLLARRKETYQNIRTLYGIDTEASILVCTFGGQPGMNQDMKEVCDGFKGVVISSNANLPFSNHIYADKEADWLDLIQGADCLLTKPGYSTFAEATQFGTPIIYKPRGDYPEEEILIKGLKRYRAKIEIPPGFSGVRSWKTLFKAALALPKGDGAYHNQSSRVASDVMGFYFKTRSDRNRLQSVFDIGSNNLNYLVRDATKNEVLHTAHFTTGIGRLACPIVAKRFKGIFSQLMLVDMRINSQKISLSAAAARENPRFSPLSEWIARKYQVRTMILEQNMEARLAYLAAMNTIDLDDDLIVVDIGGQSIELIWGLAKNQWKGIPTGLMHLYKNPGSDQIDHVYEQLPDITDADSKRLVITGLTGTLLASVIDHNRLLHPWNYHSRTITGAQVSKLALELDDADRDKKHHHLHGASDESILKASLTLVSLLLDKYQALEIVVCYYGISLGICLSERIRKAQTRKNK